MAAASPAFTLKFVRALLLGGVLAGLAPGAKTAEAEPPKPREDRYGDPLPPGAIARLGTVRFRHPGAVHAVAFSEDGKLLAASSDDRCMVVIWDRATGRKLREIPVASRTLPPYHLRFSPDGKRLYGSLWYGPDRRLLAWDVQTGADARDIPRLPAQARALGYSPDGREVILLVQQEKEIVRWDIEKGEELGRYPKPGDYPGDVARVGERLLVPHFTGQSIVMSDVARKKQLWSVETTRDKNYTGPPMAFSADGKHFATEAPAGVIWVYDSLTGEKVRRLEGDSKMYFTLNFSPDGRTIAGLGWGGLLRLWDLKSGRERTRIPAPQGSVAVVSFAPDSKSFATGGGGSGHAVLLWETATGKPIDPYPGHTCRISSVSFTPDGRTAATSSGLDGGPVAWLWDPQTGRPLRSLEATKSGNVPVVVYSPDGEKLATCDWSGERKVRIWDARTGRQLHALTGHEAGCTCVAFSPDGKRLASSDAYYNRQGQGEGRLCIWDVETGKRIHEIRGTRGAIQRVRFTRDGRHVLAGADGVHVYDAETGQPDGEPFHSKSRIWSLALSADGRLLATADGRGPVRLWELATRREIPLGLPDADGSYVDLTPDGRTLAASSSKGGVILFHWPSGRTVARLPGGAGVETGAYFSPDARRLATASHSDSSAIIWDVAGLVDQPLPTVARPTEADLKRWWADLNDGSPDEAYQVFWRFVATPEQTLPFLADSLRPLKASQREFVDRLIDDLDSPQFQARDRAARELERLGEVVVPALRKAKKGKPPLEQSRRIDQLLDKLAGAEQVRASRSVAVLEQIGSPEARKILAQLATGDAEARLTQEAKASLERLARRRTAQP
jgi:WD40 repeat protein